MGPKKELGDIWTEEQNKLTGQELTGQELQHPRTRAHLGRGSLGCMAGYDLLSPLQTQQQNH